MLPTSIKGIEKHSDAVTPRKIWDLPHQTVIKALELADLSTVMPNLSPEETMVLKEKLKRGETFVIDKKIFELKSSSNSNLLINEKPPEIINKLATFKNTNNLVNLLFTPEKIATLKATKNLLLGVTFGQFDPKNTNMLRTCSEPDLVNLIDLDDDKEKKKVDNKGSKLNSTKGSETIRLVRSLDELDKIKDKLIETDSSEVFF